MQLIVIRREKFVLRTNTYSTKNEAPNRPANGSRKPHSTVPGVRRAPGIEAGNTLGGYAAMHAPGIQPQDTLKTLRDGVRKCFPAGKT